MFHPHFMSIVLQVPGGDVELPSWVIGLYPVLNYLITAAVVALKNATGVDVSNKTLSGYVALILAAVVVFAHGLPADLGATPGAGDPVALVYWIAALALYLWKPAQKIHDSLQGTPA